MAINPKDFPKKVRPGIRADEKFRRFFLLFKIDGRQHKAVLDYSKKAWGKRDRISRAEAELAKRKEQARMGVDTGATVDYFVDMYFDTLSDGKYKHERRSFYRRYVSKKLGKKKVIDVLPMHIHDLVQSLEKKGLRPGTVKQILEILNPAFKLAISNRLIRWNPCDDVRVKKPPTRKIVTGASEKLKLIHDAIMDEFGDDPYYRAFFLLALHGRRKSEIINLDCEDVSFEFDVYVIRDTKNSEDQRLFLPPGVKKALREFMGESGPVFAGRFGGRIVSVKRQTARLKQRLGDWFSMHYMRNVIVSAMAEQGADPTHLSGALGHRDAGTVNKYLTPSYMVGSTIASRVVEAVVRDDDKKV